MDKKERKLVQPIILDFKQRLSKWMFQNSESVCGEHTERNA